jgi:polysaccharide biosynthesis/export protein
MKGVGFAACVLGAMLALPLAAQNRGAGSSDGNGTKTPATTNPVVDPNYLIGPLDVLDITVWKNPDVSRTVPVRPDGKISLPLINDVDASGRTPLQLQALITEKLSKFLNTPQVTVIVTQVNSQRVYVLGMVVHPGAFPLLPDMTVLQAIASAGGIGQFAKDKDIYILRTVGAHQERYPFNYRDVIKGKHPEQNILLKPGDNVVVP